MTLSTIHPVTGEAISPLGYYRSGRPIWPIMGGSEPAPEGDPKPEDDPKPEGDPDPKPDDDGLGDAGKKALAAERQKARDAEKRAKAAEAERDKIRNEHASDAEKALNAARAEGVTEASKQWAPRVVRAEFKAAAAGRFTAEQLNELLEDLDLSKYLTDDGEVDEARIAKKIDALAPDPGKSKVPSFNGGPRTPAQKRAGSLGEAISNRLAANKS